ncbi:hypothetical protein GCM10023205_54140 [Yinghuangia aomiensis]|uniref:Uncharacterized protein n=1 Tax=Yinghuangia aomiensis TaxID=676205 RepID=A0ABP9HUJ7_9ACTN
MYAPAPARPTGPDLYRCWPNVKPRNHAVREPTHWNPLRRCGSRIISGATTIATISAIVSDIIMLTTMPTRPPSTTSDPPMPSLPKPGDVGLRQFP